MEATSHLGATDWDHGGRQRTTVLVVDDCRPTADSYAGILRLAGYEVLVAETGQAALACAATSAFDVGLLDLRMPDMSGVELLRTLKARGVSAPLVVVTAFPDFDSAFEAAAAGAAGYVDAPLEGEDVCRLVRAVLSGARFVRAPDATPAGPRGTMAADPDMLRAVRLLSTEEGRRWTVRALADRLGVSESRLRHRFRLCAGLPLSQYMLHRRLLRAKVLLRTTRIPVDAIAAALGWADPRGFRRAFRNHVGLSPTALRTRSRS